MEPRIHTHVGMTTIEARRLVPVAMIKPQQGDNKARAKGLVDATIKKFQRLLNNGKYEPMHELPPVVIEKKDGKYDYSLVAGEHRLQGHRGVDRKEMWVQVVKFDKRETLLAFQSIENIPGEDHVETPRTQEDVIGSATYMLEEKGYSKDKTPSERMIATIVTDLKIREHEKTIDKENVKKALLKDFGMVASVQTYDRSAAEDYIRNNHNDMSTALAFNSFVSVSGEERDLDFRFMTTVMDYKMKNPSCPITAYLAWHKLDANQVEVVRPLKKTYLTKTFIDKIHKWSDIFNHPDYTDIEIEFLPQLDKDFENEIN